MNIRDKEGDDMKKSIIISVVALISVAAILAVALPMLGFGFASQSQTDSTGNTVGTEYHIIATPDTGSMVQIPSVRYYASEGYYVPEVKIKETTGKLDIKVKEDSNMYIRVMSTFNNSLSWSLMERLDLDLNTGNGWVRYSLYDSTSDTLVGVTGNPSQKIPIIQTGVYNFKLVAQYKNTIKVDPTAFHDSNMRSNVIFVLSIDDPIEAKTRTFSFTTDPNDGAQGEMSNQTLDQSYPYLKKNEFTRTGWSFAHWDLNDHTPINDQSNVYDLIDGSDSIVTLTAHWGKKISFYPNGGSGVMKDQVISDDQHTLQSNTFVNSKCHFDGWATSANGNVVYSDGDSSLSWEVADGTKLFAHWTPYTLTLTLQLDNSTTATRTITVVNHTLDTMETIATAESFTKPTGCVFLGWSKTQDGKPTILDGSDLTDSIDDDSNTTDTLYAIWGKTVNFNSNYGIGSMGDQTWYVGAKLNKNTFTRAGYSFVGWAKSSGGSKAFDDQQTLDSLNSIDVDTLYALLQLVNYNVTLVAGDNGSSSGDATANVGSQYAASFTANSGYEVNNISVTIGGYTAIRDTDYTVSTVGQVTTITISQGIIIGDVDITVTFKESAQQ